MSIRNAAVLNIAERALWTGVQTGLAIVTVEAITPLSASSGQVLLAAAVATTLSGLKTFSQERLAQLQKDAEE